VFRKERRGDREVRLAPPTLKLDQVRTPVLVDDIISSGATMREAANLLIANGMRRPYCIAVHVLFDESVAAELRSVAEVLLTTDSIPNPYSAFSIAPLIAEQLGDAST
jgi:ribose-phosphate pyrophosphokinase